MSIILAEYNVKPFVMCLFLLSLTSLKMEFFFSSSILVEMTFNSFLSFFKLMSFGRYARVTLHNISLFLTILYTILCNIITTTTVSVAITNETWIFNRKKKREKVIKVLLAISTQEIKETVPLKSLFLLPRRYKNLKVFS